MRDPLLSNEAQQLLTQGHRQTPRAKARLPLRFERVPRGGLVEEAELICSSRVEADALGELIGIRLARDLVVSDVATQVGMMLT